MAISFSKYIPIHLTAFSSRMELKMGFCFLSGNETTHFLSVCWTMGSLLGQVSRLHLLSIGKMR